VATGIPSKNSRRNVQHEVGLVYQNKASKLEILATPSAHLRTLWKGAGNCLNRLYFGDNLTVLAALLEDKNVVGKVRLIYIDPPFSTQSTFFCRKLEHAYEDTLAGSGFLEFLRKRLFLLRELLASDGSIYLHLDEKMVFHMKLIMDEIFGSRNYRNCITRKKCSPKNYTRKTYGNVADYILFYTKYSKYVWNRLLEPWTKERAKEYQYTEPENGRRYMKVPVHAPGTRNGETGKPWRGMLPPPGKHWQFPPSKLDEMDARGVLHWSANGNPRRKVYLDQNPGIGVQDIWLDFKDAHNQNIKITGYPTEKNSELLNRIILASSNTNDMVLDCFSGSGTTLAVSSQSGRTWIGIDNSEKAISTTLARFERGTHRMGDFVKNSGKTKADYQSSLFDSVEALPAECSSPNKHKPILNFSLFAEESYVEESERLLSNWSRYIRSYPSQASLSI